MSEVIIEFDAAQPPAGRVITPVGELSFEGWLSLLSLLEHVASELGPDQTAG
ncbi:MAG: hypothetical protein KY469_04430 [Actinobacteria bacterium]|nr:hypothetical protein [Actinomycetota bacterium]